MEADLATRSAEWEQRGRGWGTVLKEGVLSRRGRGNQNRRRELWKSGEGGRGEQVKGKGASGRGDAGKWDREEGCGPELKRSGGQVEGAGRIQWKRREGPIEMGRGTKWKGEGMQRERDGREAGWRDPGRGR